MRIEIKDKENFIKMFNNLFKENKITDINGITIDSRKVESNDLFIPIKGKNYDGHNYISSALNSGAQLSFSQMNKKKNNIININCSKELIHQLAKTWHDKSQSKVIGITGSNGKTTTKELLFSILSKQYKCSKSEGNFNSSIGLPLTFLSSKLNDDFCILEYGASRPNEIKKLCKTIKPAYSLITNISEAHIENFSSLNEIIDTKSAIYKNLKCNDTAFVNNDIEELLNIKTKGKKITFGFKNKSKFNGKIILDDQSYLKVNNEIFPVPYSLVHLKNSLLSTISISLFLNITKNNIVKALNTFILPIGRGERFIKNNLEIIDDSYNANPESVKLAIERFNSINTKGKKIFVFGDMLELGEKTIISHQNISSLLNKSKINVLLTYGNFSKLTYNGINNNAIRIKHFTDIEKLKIFIHKISKKGDLIYLKGSRSMELERLYKGS